MSQSKDVLKTLFTAAAFSLACQCLYAQSKITEGKGCRMEQAGKDVYAIIHDDATDQWPHGNTGVVIGRDAVLVVDACYLPSMAAEDIRLIRSITSKPVKYLVYTHWHMDHNNGGSEYKKAFPDVSVISEEETARFIGINSPWWVKMNLMKHSAKRKDIIALERQLAIGKDTVTGIAFSASEVLKRKKIIEQRKNELREFETFQLVRPDKTFSGSLNLDLGGRTVQLKDMGKANSPHDVTIYVPDEQVLFTGDMLVQSPLPYLGASWPVHWVKVLADIEKVTIKTMVMGHGPIQHDHSYTRQMREFLAGGIAKVEKMLEDGLTLDEAKTTFNMDEYRKGVWARPEDTEDWKGNLQVIIERMWRSVRGQG